MWRVATDRSRLIGRIVKNLQTSLAALNVTDSVSKKLSGGPAASASHQSVPVTIPVPWGHIAGKAWGQPSGLPVLAVHGWLDNAGSFDNLIPLLSDDLYVVAVDLPGHGQSSHRQKGAAYHFMDYVIDLKYIANGLDWKKFMIIGHSMGGSAVSWFAAALPDYVTCVVLIDGAGPLTFPLVSLHQPHSVLSFYLSQNDIPVLLGRELRGIDNSVPSDKVYSSWDAIVDKVQSGNRYDKLLDRASAEILAHRGAQWVEGGYSFTHDRQLKDPFPMLQFPDVLNDVFLQQISCPVLAVCCEKTFIPQHVIKRRIRNMTKAKLSVLTVPGGHHVHLYNPRVMSEQVNTFLTSQGQNGP